MNRILFKLSGKPNNDNPYPTRETLFEKDVTLIKEPDFRTFLIEMYNTFLKTKTHFDLAYIIEDAMGTTYQLTDEQERLLFHGGKQ